MRHKQLVKRTGAGETLHTKCTNPCEISATFSRSSQIPFSLRAKAFFGACAIDPGDYRIPEEEGEEELHKQMATETKRNRPGACRFVLIATKRVDAPCRPQSVRRGSQELTGEAKLRRVTIICEGVVGGLIDSVVIDLV
uniref:Uncharacterized protein n=1 Tax=Steinernema glaseri TaxID=37863 RepID=A0A1I8AR62_9BILA